MAYSRITDKLKQHNKEANVDKSAYFYLMDSVDIHYAINGFQSQVATPSDDENHAYIITDPHNLHANFGGIQNGKTGLYEIFGKTVGTGDIIRSVRIEDRELLGTTYSIEFDASNTGDKTEESLGNLGQIIFNDYDKRHYGWNGTTWSDLVSDYVKSVVNVGGTITITKGNGDESTIPIGVTIGVSGESPVLFSQQINLVQGTNVDINISTGGDTTDIEFAVTEIIAGTLGT